MTTTATVPGMEKYYNQPDGVEDRLLRQFRVIRADVDKRGTPGLITMYYDGTDVKFFKGVPAGKVRE